MSQEKVNQGAYMHHDIKQFSGSFKSLMDREMKAQARRNDRNYQVNDTTTFHVCHPAACEGGYEYTGQKGHALITCVDTFGMAEGYVNLSFELIDVLILED